MSERALDLPRAIQIVRRHRVLVAIAVLLGIVAGGAYATFHPPMLTSTALVVLPQSAQSAAAAANAD